MERKKRRWTRAVFSLVAVLAAVCAGCGRPGSGGEEKRLVVCTSEREGLIDAVIPLFEEKYGIQVRLVQGESMELLEKIKGGEEPGADVVMGLSLTEVLDNRQLFLEYVSVNDKYLLESCRNTTGYATSYVLNGSCFIVNQTLAKEYSVSGYQDLLNPALKGKITMADPAASTTGFAQLVNMLEAKGGCEKEEAWEYVGLLIGQTRGYAANSGEVSASVAKGEYIVGLSHEDAGASLMREGADVSIVYPCEGTLYSPRTAAIVKDGPHPEYAKHFVDFITGKDMQDIFGTLLCARPVRQDAKTSQYLQDMKSIPVITEDKEYAGFCKKKIWEHYRALMRTEE